MTLWHTDTLTHRHTDTLTHWDTETMTQCHFEEAVHDWHFDTLTHWHNDTLRRLFMTVTNASNKPFSFDLSKESTDSRTEKRKIQVAQLAIEPRPSGSAHQGSDHWAITPQPLAALNILLLIVYQCQCYTIGWLSSCRLQPTETKTLKCHLVYGLTSNSSSDEADREGDKYIK